MLAPCCACRSRHGRSCIASSFQRVPETDHARYRRHVRRGPWWAAVAAVQCALRRIRRFQRDRRVRWRRSLSSLLPFFVPPNGPAARRSAPSCAACCARSAPTGRRPRDPTARRQSLLQSGGSRLVSRPTVSITSWASRRPRHCAGISGISRPARKLRFFEDAEQRQGAPLQGVRRRGRDSGAASSASSPASKPAQLGPTHASSPPISTPAMRACSMRMSTAGVARPKITSTVLEDASGGGPPLAPKPRPTSCGCFCTRAHTGSCGACACRCPNVLMWRVAQIRHVTPAAHQNRRPRRRDEDDDQEFTCLRRRVPPRNIVAARAPGVSRAWSLEQRGVAPGASNHFHQPPNLLHPVLRLVTGLDPPRLQSRKNRNGSRERTGDVHRKMVEERVHNGG